LEELPVHATAGTWQPFSHADLFGNAPVALKARLHWPLVASQSKLTQQLGCRPLVHSSWTQPSQLSLVFNHEWQQVLHTSHPENVWPQTFELLNFPQFKGVSHGGTEAPVTTERAARPAKRVGGKLHFCFDEMRFKKKSMKGAAFYLRSIRWMREGRCPLRPMPPLSPIISWLLEEMRLLLKSP
jgi:hypothetical protein